MSQVVPNLDELLAALPVGSPAIELLESFRLDTIAECKADVEKQVKCWERSSQEVQADNACE